MVAFAGRVEAKLTVPSGGAAVSATNSGGGPTTCTVPAGNYFLTAAGGVSSLLTTLQTQLNSSSQGYPQIAAAMAAAVGYGAWSAGWLFNIASGNDSGAFGGVTMTAVSSPTYGTEGPRGGIDKAIGFNSASDAFSAGNNFDVGATDDLIIAWVGQFTATPASNYDLFSKTAPGLAGAGWYLYHNGGGAFQFTVGDAADTATVTCAIPAANVWYAAIAVLERATNKIRVGYQALDGSSSLVSTLTDATAVGSLSNAISFLVGNGDITGSGPHPNALISAFYVAKGNGAATGLGANLSTALTNFANAINAAWSVSLSTTDGRVSIDWTGYTTPTWSLSWTDTNLRDVLGFTANISNVTTTQTGVAQAKGLWLPDCSLTVEGDPERAPLVSDAVASVTPTGRVVTHVGNTFRRHRSLTWSHVPIAQVWDAEATYENGSWEEFYIETQLGLGSTWFTPGSPIQIYDHNGIQVGADASVAGWYIIGLNSIEPRKSVRDWTGLWRIEIPTLVAAGS